MVEAPVRMSAEGHDEGTIAPWGYEADNGPDVWGSMDPEWALCAEGREQSPIDLANATQIELTGVEIDTPSDQEVVILNQEEVRHAWVDSDTERVGDTRRESTLAFNWFLAGHDNKITLDSSVLTLQQPSADHLSDARVRLQWDLSF